MMPTLTLMLPTLLPGYDILRLAAGTTMATMAAGALSATYSRFHAGHIDFRLLRLVLAPYICGALIGPWVSRYLPTEILRWYLAVIIVVIAVRLLSINDSSQRSTRNYRDHPFELSFVLLIIGIGSSIAGIASGLFTIPYLTRFSLSMRTIMGTATAGAAVYSTFGAIGYLTAGWSTNNLPSGAIGFIYLPVFAVMAATTFFCPPLGVRLARYANESLLRRFFAIFLLVASIAIISL